MKLENIKGRPAIRYPDGEYAGFMIDPTNSSPGMLATLGAGSGGSLVTQPLTGGSNGNFVIRTGPTTVVDADPLMKTRLSTEPLLLKVKRGEYHHLTGILPLPITAAEAIRDAEGRAGTIVLAPRQNGRNWRIYRGAVPADLDPVLNPQQVYYEVGSVWSEGLFHAAPYRAPANPSADSPITRYYDDFSSAAPGAAPPVLEERWQALGLTLAYDVASESLKQTLTGNYRRALAYLPAGQFIGGRARLVSSFQVSTSGKEIRLQFGTTGAGNAAAPASAGTETAWIAQLLGTGNLSIYRYVNGVVTGGSALSVISGGLVVDRKYAVEMERSEDGRVMQARAYAHGDAIPAWQRSVTSDAWKGAGYLSIANHGTGSGGRSTYHELAVTVGPGELAS